MNPSPGARGGGGAQTNVSPTWQCEWVYFSHHLSFKIQTNFLFCGAAVQPTTDIFTVEGPLNSIYGYDNRSTVPFLQIAIYKLYSLQWWRQDFPWCIIWHMWKHVHLINSLARMGSRIQIHLKISLMTQRSIYTTPGGITLSKKSNCTTFTSLTAPAWKVFGIILKAPLLVSIFFGPFPWLTITNKTLQYIRITSW